MNQQRLFARAHVSLVAASVACALLASLGSFYAPASVLPKAVAATFTVDTSARTEDQVRAAWAQLKPVYTGSAYSVVPSVVAPYAPGDAAAGYRTDGVNMINFGRYLAGLPRDVTLSSTRNSNGQYGSVLLSASTFSHTPPKPAAMDDSFYAIGYAATSSSNIGGGYTTSWSFQKGCLDDDDAGNITRVGHRRWLLNPRMLYTGIGYAEGYHTTYAFDSSRSSTEVSYDFVAWPSAGVFPVDFASRYTPWSVTLNPAKYDWDATRTGHTVTMRRVRDGATWTLDAADTDTTAEYFNADFGGYGVANVFIFRPDPATIAYAPGDQFDITLSGGIYAEGTKTPVSVSYRTSFGALTGASTTFASPLDPTTPEDPTIPEDPTTPPAPTTTFVPVYRFFNKAISSHFYTASVTERDAVIARYAATYAYEGVAYSINTANPANYAPLYRFFNKSNGSHFYTPSVAERDAVIAQWSATYAYEGPAYNVSLTSGGCAPMYRFYNKTNGSHFYTVSAEERDAVIAGLAHIYSYEGITYFVGN
ncbi:MAG: hypothetical protein Q7W51_06515 [Coriobacteriia bacterium]|nr:hypothetical protein [Coriobacteriia bacterium]